MPSKILVRQATLKDCGKLHSRTESIWRKWEIKTIFENHKRLESVFL